MWPVFKLIRFILSKIRPSIHFSPLWAGIVVSGGCLEGVLRVSKGIYGISEWYMGCLDVSEGQIRIGQVRTDQVRSSQVRTGQVRTGQVRIG